MTELEFKVLREISNNSDVSQRELSRKIRISLGKTNHIVRRLVERGLVKAIRLKNSKNKIAYAYFLTPKGIREQIKETRIRLKKSYEEYLTLKAEIEHVKEKQKKSDNCSFDSS